MRDTSALLRLTAVVLVTVLCLTLAAPARAEAVDVLLIVGIAGLAVVAVIVIVYLVVASSRGPKMPAEAAPIMLACVETETDVEARNCWPVSGPLVSLPGTAGAPGVIAIPMAPAAPAPMEAVPQS